MYGPGGPDDNRVGDILPNGENVIEGAIVGLGPHLTGVVHLHELGRNPDAAAGLPDAAFDDAGDIERGADLANSGAHSFEREGEVREATRITFVRVSLAVSSSARPLLK